MLEVLISIFIILLGLLGLAGLIVRSNQAEMESYQRVQAVMLVQDMVDRMNANRKDIANYVANVGTGSVVQDCTAPATRAGIDLCEWNNALLGNAETQGGTNVGAMIGARGCVTVVDAANRIYLVSVAWQGLAATADAPNTNACGLNQYQDEKLRRLVTATVRIGALL